MFSLKSVFKLAVVTVPLMIAGAIFWQSVLDPIFFPAVHAALTNPTMSAYMAFMQDSFSWVTDALGFTGNGGLLNTEFAQNILEPYMPDLPSVDDYVPPTLGTSSSTFSFDDIT